MIAVAIITVKTLRIACSATQFHEKNKSRLNLRPLDRFSLRAKHFIITHLLLQMKKTPRLYLTVLKTIFFLVTVNIKALFIRLFLNFAETVKNGTSYDQHPDSWSCLFPLSSKIIRQLLSRIIQSQRRRTGEGVFSGLMYALQLRNPH